MLEVEVVEQKTKRGGRIRSADLTTAEMRAADADAFLADHDAFDVASAAEHALCTLDTRKQETAWAVERS